MRWTPIVAAGIALLLGPTAVRAADPIGEAAKVEDTLTGPAGKLVTGASIFFNDKLATDATGVGQIVFKDGTKLAIGPNAEVTIDKFVYKDDGTFSELAVSMTKGAFRWISGKSKPEAYKLSTGWANLAIRGTAFDLNVDPAGSFTLVLYEGDVTVCLATGDCRTVSGQCRYIVAETRIEVNDAKRLPRSTALALKKSGVIPFIDNERLMRPFHLKNASCKVRKVQKQRKAQRVQRTKRAARATRTKTAALTITPAPQARGPSASARKGRTTSSPDPTPPSSPDPAPSAMPDAIDSPTPTVEGPTAQPSKPGKPGKRGRRGHRGKHGHHGKGKGYGNPGNDSNNGQAGENPNGGYFGDGKKGKSDSKGKGGGKQSGGGGG